jgi:hypothetical protein
MTTTTQRNLTLADPSGRCVSNGAHANVPAANKSGTANAHDTAAQETPGVASLFLTSTLHLADDWLCDSGASSTMSGNRSAFRELKPDRRAIRLADGKLVYSAVLGAIRFLSSCGYIITIHDALYVPHLAANLFGSNKFAKRHSGSLSEVIDYPRREWVNQRTGAVEFTATIQGNDLTYLDWGVTPPRKETASVSMCV